jgi:hypothetical protein
VGEGKVGQGEGAVMETAAVVWLGGGQVDSYCLEGGVELDGISSSRTGKVEASEGGRGEVRSRKARPAAGDLGRRMGQ